MLRLLPDRHTVLMIMDSVPSHKILHWANVVLLHTKRMQLWNHAHTQTVKHSQRSKDYAIYIYRIKSRKFEVRENEISLRKLSGGIPQLRTLEETLIMEMLANRSFTLITGNGQTSRLRRLKNGVPQGSVSSTSTFLSCQPPCPERMHMLTI